MKHGGNGDGDGIQSLSEGGALKTCRNPSLIIPEKKETRMSMNKSRGKGGHGVQKVFSLSGTIIIIANIY